MLFYFEPGEVILYDSALPKLRLEVLVCAKIFYDGEGEHYRLTDRNPNLCPDEQEDVLKFIENPKILE